MGPRRPDKRNAAYESIFGRPSATHHQLHPPGQFPPSPLSYQQQPYLQQAGQPYPYYQPNASQAQLDRRTSQSSFRTPSGQYPQQQAPPNTFRQSYYPSNSPASQSPHPTQSPFQHPHYPQQQQQPYAYASSLAPPSVVSRARSIGSSPGVIAPLPEEPPDPELEQLTQAGLTPAQAYQAQVYRTNGGSMGQQQSWAQQEPQRQQQQNNQPLPSPTPSAPAPYHSGPRGPRPQSAQTMPPSLDKVPEALPQISMQFESDDGRLGLDFSLNGMESSASTEVTPPSDSGLEEDLSELPYSKPHRMSTPNSMRSRVSVSSTPGGSGDFTNGGMFPPSSSSRPYPLQLDTALASAHAAGVSLSPASSTLVDEPQTTHGNHAAGPAPVHSAPYGRRSSESAKTMPGQFHRNRGTGDRSQSMSAAMSPHVRAMIESGRAGRPPVPSAAASGRDSAAPRPRRAPIVYPALLSRVAEAFKTRLQLGDRIKDGLTYKESFDGREAVDTIAYIIKTTDRNLALLLGRALDAQKFFHAVTYDHRLRDSSHDLYQFRTKLPSPFVSGELANVPPEHEELLKALGGTGQPLIGSADSDDGATKESPTPSAEAGDESSEKKSRSGSPSPSVAAASPVTRPRAGSISSDDVPLPTGVFTLLTDCYSPTCTRDQLCYSIACPRRLEQQARLNMKPQRELKKQISRESLGDLVVWRSYVHAWLWHSDRSIWDAALTGTRHPLDPLRACGSRRKCFGPGEEAPGGDQRGHLYRARLRAGHGVLARRMSFN